MTRMTSKGQVTIPKRMRDYLGLKPGSEIEFGYAGNGRVQLAIVAERRPVSRFAAIRGILGPGMTTDEVMRLTRGWDEPDREER